MIVQVDYQEIISIMAEMIKVSIPIGLIWGITRKILRMFFSIAFGERDVKL